MQEVATGGQGRGEGGGGNQNTGCFRLSALAGVGLVELHGLNFGWTWAQHI